MEKEKELLLNKRGQLKPLLGQVKNAVENKNAKTTTNLKPASITVNTAAERSQAKPPKRPSSGVKDFT